ncbi:GTP-binding protein [Buchnera aphidicola (Cinara tujafilina)]|uniref:GTPase Der n=1 Tax=Buchnera aphidicola (Cinara tujafilina) TaxID=261317 RepID=F7WZT2_9GAMM|nr:ribosome biogenesis GTPase Der [Buchnera aphidicola]AEH39958.1 GTP-binding protein [Buchnera aphidicola (Cinara tujafilina)]
MTPIITLIGRTNVGKSSFFNFLTDSNIALVNSIPGTTRDRNYNFFYINKKIFLIDTAGIEILDPKYKKSNNLYFQIYSQTILAIRKSTFIFFMVDIQVGLTNTEYFILEKIRLENKKIFLLINKVDLLKNFNNLLDFYDLGIYEIYKISVMHRTGIHDFLKNFYKTYKKSLNFKQLEIEKKKKNNKISKNILNTIDDIDIKICITGKSNVGKSSLINRILKKNRMIVHHKENTTRGIIRSIIKHKDKSYILTDTEGLRRKTKKNNLLEHISMLKVMNEIKISHITIVVLDASLYVCSQDLFILNTVYKKGKSFYVIINKWDLIKKINRKKVKEEILQRLHFIKNNKIFCFFFIEYWFKRFFKIANEVYYQSIRNFSASYLTKLINLAIKKHPIPMGVTGKAIRLKYAHLGGKNPFLIIIHGTQTQFLTRSYKKYLINFLQKALQIPSTPIRLFFKNSYNPYYNKK